MGVQLHMFVVLQFPIADGRAFASQSGVVDRPDWNAPTLPALRAHRDFVRGFGRLVYRRTEANAAWIDEDFFAYAKRAVRFPTLDRRHFRSPHGGRWMVSCRFRRLFSDGVATVRLEIGFQVTTTEHGSGRPTSTEVIGHLLGLPAVVPGGWPGTDSKDLMLLGPYFARRYALASTRHQADPSHGAQPSKFGGGRQSDRGRGGLGLGGRATTRRD